MFSPQKHEKGAGIYDAESVYPKIARAERAIDCQFRVWLQEKATASVDGVNQLDDAHQCIGFRAGRYLYYADPASRNIRGQDNKVSSMTEETPVIILEDNLRAWQSIITGIYHGHG
jgi:hypothetical protein